VIAIDLDMARRRAEASGRRIVEALMCKTPMCHEAPTWACVEGGRISFRCGECARAWLREKGGSE
jgi:hypothetical protein